MRLARTEKIRSAVDRFVSWLDRFGETSFDHQSYYAGPFGRRAKALYYRNRFLGALAVSPMVFSEALIPSARRLFWKKMRLPIADAHYAMGFALLHRETGIEAYSRRALHFLEVLIETRTPKYAEFCWGYPFDWITQKGTIEKGEPLITTTPYAFEAFDLALSIDGRDRWPSVMRSIAQHAMNDIGDFPVSSDTASSGYHPKDTEGGVINASAYRAFLLARASRLFDEPSYRERAERYLNFVLKNQRADGSWPYEAGGSRNFIDHFHTCFVIKALAKIDKAEEHEGLRSSIEKGVSFYVRELFDQDGLPKPFFRAPRLTVYRNELYDYAECINLGILLRGRFPDLDEMTDRAIDDLLARWQKPDGSFRSRRLRLGWDNVPMHRWGQSQIFRSLCLALGAGPSLDGRMPG